MNLLFNQIGYSIINPNVSLFYSISKESENDSLKEEWFNEELRNCNTLISSDDLISKNKNQRIYFSFNSSDFEHDGNVNINLEKSWVFKKYYVKSIFENTFAKDYLVEKNPTSADLSIYEKKLNTHKTKPDWTYYLAYNFIFYKNYITLALKSQEILISNINVEKLGISTDDLSNIVDGNYVKHKDKIKAELLKNKFCIANSSIKKLLNIPRSVNPLKYENYYNLIFDLYYTFLAKFDSNLKLYENGFRKLIPDKDYFFVFKDSNLIEFKNGQTNVNISNGMKYGGVYKEPPNEKLNNIEYIFIYPSRNYANSLFRYLKDGLKHFPGLESYVGVPVPRPNTDLSFQYKDINTLNIDLEKHLSEKLESDTIFLKNFFAYVILPFNKQTASENESRIYYSLKQLLLSKNIVSQFIDTSRIISNDFHFHLTNMAVSINAKLGGIPWKLHNKKYNELIVGFGEYKTENEKIIGNTVYFDNSGKLKRVDYFNSNSAEDELTKALKQSILSYIKDDGKYPDRVIIHYFKPPNKKEIALISRSLSDLNLQVPYVVIEINESKSKDFIAFDSDYKYGMPISGTVIRLFKRNEYLLFNNTRYDTNPRGFINEEYPIKIRLHHQQGIELDEFEIKKIISQIYEFSRIYWKSLRQQSLPVTIKYSKFIANYAAHFENNEIPKNQISKESVWFI